MEDRQNTGEFFAYQPRQTQPAAPQADTKPSPAASKENAVESSRDQFTGHGVPLQITVPADLRESLKLRAYMQGVSMSELAIHYLTHGEVVQKAWITGRKAS
jgi:hypothetical protein